MQRDLRQFGFGRPTGLDLPSEGAGRIPDAAWMREQYEADPKAYPTDFLLPGDYIQMTIGQGAVTVTPLQLAAAYAAIANGGQLCEPRLAAEVVAPRPGRDKSVRPIKSDCRKLPYSTQQLNYIQAALGTVPLSGGTAADAFQGFPFARVSVAGKTGTAEVPPFQDYSWFAATASAGSGRVHRRGDGGAGRPRLDDRRPDRAKRHRGPLRTGADGLRQRRVGGLMDLVAGRTLSAERRPIRHSTPRCC